MPASVARLLNIRPVTIREARPVTRLLDYECFIGVEMELENDTRRAVRSISAYNAARSGLVIKEDGSLRNGGVELVFAEPLTGSSAENAIDAMFTIRDTYGLVGSFRTSTHVHVNYASEEDTAAVLAKAVTIWLLIERAAALTCGEAREFNSFCVPTYLTSPQAERAVYMLTTMDDDTDAATAQILLQNAVSHHRYAAMNLAALVKFGTIEYRLLGTASKDVTYNWINLLLEIKKSASTFTREYILAHPTFLGFIRSVLPRTGDYLVYSQDVEEAYVEARERVLAPLGTDAYDDMDSTQEMPLSIDDTLLPLDDVPEDNSLDDIYGSLSEGQLARAREILLSMDPRLSMNNGSTLRFVDTPVAPRRPAPMPSMFNQHENP